MLKKYLIENRIPFKILRGTMRKIADNEPYKMPTTIDDPAILGEIKEHLKKHQILK